LNLTEFKKEYSIWLKEERAEQAKAEQGRGRQLSRSKQRGLEGQEASEILRRQGGLMRRRTGKVAGLYLGAEKVIRFNYENIRNK